MVVATSAFEVVGATDVSQLSAHRTSTRDQGIRQFIEVFKSETPAKRIENVIFRNVGEDANSREYEVTFCIVSDFVNVVVCKLK